MDIAPIKNQRDDRRALKEIEGLTTARRNSPEGDQLDVLVTLVEAWERKHYPLDLPDPVEAIKYHMDQSGLAPRDLIPFIGSRNRVHEVLNRECHGLSLGQSQLDGEAAIATKCMVARPGSRSASGQSLPSQDARVTSASLLKCRSLTQHSTYSQNHN